jgi:hypothetical protein
MSATELAALIAAVLVLLAAGAVAAIRGRAATEPGLPPVDDPLKNNPPPLGSYIDPD